MITDLQSLAVIGNNVYAGTWGGGVWWRPISEMMGAINPYPKNLLMQDNYKINFTSHINSIATIGFSLPHSDQVSINVYNLSGKKITSLVNKRLGSGSYSLSWNTRNMAACYYVVRMQVGPNTYIGSIPIFR